MMRDVKGRKYGIVHVVNWIPILTRFFILSAKSRSGGIQTELRERGPW